MTKSWNWSWKLGLRIAVVTSAFGLAVSQTLAPCGDYALAQESIGIVESWGLKPNPIIDSDCPSAPGKLCGQVPGVTSGASTSGASKLRLKSISSDAFAYNPSLNKIYVHIKEAGLTWGPYPINPGEEVQLGIDKCFNNTLTVTLLYQNNEEKPQFVGEQPVSITYASSLLPLVFEGNNARYTLNYQIEPGDCRS